MRHQNLRSFLGSISDRVPFSQPWGIPGKTIKLFSLFLLAASCVAARADNGVRAVRLSNVVGTVQILNGTETQFSQAYPNMPLMQGSTVKTGEDGRAEIQFEDGSIVRLTPNTSAMMSVLRRSSEGNTNTEVDLQAGLSYVTMSGADNQRFVVHFGNAEVISPVPVKFRVNLDANPMEFAVLDGTAHLSSGAVYAVDVKANETVRFDATDSSRYFLAQGIDGDSWDQWNSDRDQAMSQMASQQTRVARGSMNPNDPGWSDLDYYGNWYNAPGGGTYWSPSGAGAGWDPYGSGYWGNYGSGGYSWISGYPWGWLPYHCGTWNYYNSSVWGWAPGGCGSSWYPTSGIGYAPPYYVPVTRPIQRPVNPTGHLPGHGPVIVPVNRGLQATQLDPRSGAARSSVAINGHPIQPLPKTQNPASGNGFNGGSGSVAARPITAPVSRPGSGNVFVGTGGGQQLSNTPVYRPVAPPSAGYRPVAPTQTFGAHPTMGGGGQYSAPRYSAPSGPSMSSPRMSSGGGGGGSISAGGGGGGVAAGGGGTHVK